VNTAQQLGGSLGLSILVTVFAGAGGAASRHELTDGVAAALTGSAVLVTLALTIVVLVVGRAPAEVERLVAVEAD
jgi:hypothetical protein